jgi:nicotinate-nucleotide adenylyltransferase
MTQRIGLFGGSFNPIHIGHLLLAELCCEAMSLDQVLFIPANVSPLKTDNHSTVSNKHRLEMVQLAIGGNSKFKLDPRECERGGVSYTVDTVRSIVQELEASSPTLYLLMGADVLQELNRWREPAALFQLATPCVISRAGIGLPVWDKLAPYMPQEKIRDVANCFVETPLLEFSSTNLRARIQLGKSIRYQVTPSVLAYINEHHLYRST